MFGVINLLLFFQLTSGAPCHLKNQCRRFAQLRVITLLFISLITCIGVIPVIMVTDIELFSAIWEQNLIIIHISKKPDNWNFSSKSFEFIAREPHLISALSCSLEACYLNPVAWVSSVSERFKWMYLVFSAYVVLQDVWIIFLIIIAINAGIVTIFFFEWNYLLENF